MVLLSVGTQKQQFTRLIELVLNCNSLKGEKIISQSGYTKCLDSRIESFDFIPLEEMEKYITNEEDLNLSPEYTIKDIPKYYSNVILIKNIFNF